MSTSAAKSVLRVPGSLCHTPTDLTTAFPHGGTALGMVRDAELRFGQSSVPVFAEEFGTTVEVIEAQNIAVFACVLRAMDDDMLSALFEETSVGSVSGHRVVTKEVDTDTSRAGSLKSPKAVKLYFSPKALDRHPGILLFKAIPMLEESARLQVSIGEEVGIAAMWRCIPDSSGRLYEIGRRRDLTL